MLVYLLAALAPVAAAAPQLSVERIGESSFRLSSPASSTATIMELQRQLLAAARLACQNKQPVFARYRISPDEPEPTAAGRSAAAPMSSNMTLEQELLCLDAASRPTPAAAAPDPDWAPTPADQQALLAATYRYFAAKDAARYPEAHGFLSDRMQASIPLEPWTQSAREFNQAAGRALGRRVVEISWYNHPSDAPEPGIYVAADFSAEFEKLEFVCGYLMWRLLPDGSFRLVREEQNLARKRGLRPMAAIDRDPMRARLGCKD